MLYNDLGKYAEAKETYSKALHRTRSEPGELDPFVAGKIANMHADVADAYRSAGRMADAINEYSRALELRPAFGDIRTKLASAKRDVGELDEAAREFQRALEDRPNFLQARIQLGVCYYTMGRIDSMIELTGRSFSCCDGVDRRSFLRVGFLGLGSLTLPQILAHRAQAVTV